MTVKLLNYLLFYHWNCGICGRKGGKLVNYFEILKNNWKIYRVRHKLSWYYEMELSEKNSIFRDSLFQLFYSLYSNCIAS